MDIELLHTVHVDRITYTKFQRFCTRNLLDVDRALRAAIVLWTEGITGQSRPWPAARTDETVNIRVPAIDLTAFETECANLGVRIRLGLDDAMQHFIKLDEDVWRGAYADPEAVRSAETEPVPVNPEEADLSVTDATGDRPSPQQRSLRDRAPHLRIVDPTETS